MNETVSDSTNDITGLFSVPAAITNMIRKFGIDLQICMPCIVTGEYDKSNNTVKVTPLPKIPLSVNGEIEFEKRDEIEVRVRHFGCGDMVVVFPIQIGMTGWVFSSDRDPESSIEKNSELDLRDNQGPQEPSSFDMGKFTQGFFMPDRWISSGNGGFETESSMSDSIGIKILDKKNPSSKIGIFLSPKNILTVIKDGKTVTIDFDEIPEEDDIKPRITRFVKDIKEGEPEYSTYCFMRGNVDLEPNDD